jgi:AraC-like DNA-binding protein
VSDAGVAGLARHFTAGGGPLRRDDAGAAVRFTCRARDALRNVRFPAPAVIFVLDGEKEFHVDGRRLAVRSGDAVLLSPVEAIDVVNIPPADRPYRSVMIDFAAPVLDAFRRGFPELAAQGRSPAPFARLRSGRLVEAADHALAGFAADPGLSAEAMRHRLVELLLLLAEQGITWRPAAAERASERLRLLVAAQPSAEWTGAEAARRLGMSEATLRRRLRAEGSGFTRILTDTRLEHGMVLLYAAAGSIAEVALACGYRSPSRFAGLFRARFGLIPSALRPGDRPALPLPSAIDINPASRAARTSHNPTAPAAGR